jgi:hypothetical protein
MEQSESRELGLDFVNDVSEGEALTAVVWSLEVRTGVDPAPMSHLIGPAILTTPDGTGVQTATKQRVAGILPDVLYRVTAVATTDKGNTVSLWSHVSGEPLE